MKRGHRVMVATAIAGVALLTIGPDARAQERHVGAFGPTCVPTDRVGSVVSQPTLPKPTPPAATTVTVVVDVACHATVDALQRVREFRRTHPTVEVRVFIVDPSAFGRIGQQRMADLMTPEPGVPLKWDPLRVRALRVSQVPYVRVEDAKGRVVTAFGSPNLASLVAGLR